MLTPYPSGDASARPARRGRRRRRLPGPRAARRGRPGRRRSSVAESVDEVAAQRRAGALRLRPARPGPARHHRSGRAARDPAGRQRRRGLRADRPRRRAPRHRRGRRGRAGLPGQGQGRRRGARPGDPLRGRAARAPRPACCGCARSSSRRPSRAAWSAACCRRRCWPAARSGRARSTARAAPARCIGGDFFDAVLGPSGTVHAIVGDVCGHGPDEAALGVLLRVAWRALVLAGVDEPQLLPKLQQVLVSERHDRSLFTTAATVALRPADDGSARLHALVRLAGHPPPLVLGDAAALAVAPPVGLPLGIRPTRAGPPSRSPSSPAGRCCCTPTASSRAGCRSRRTALDRRTDRRARRRTRHRDLDRLPERLVERAEQLNGGALVDDVAILLLSHDAAPSDAAPADWRWPRGSAHDGDRPRLDPALDGSDARRPPSPPVLTPDRAGGAGRTPASPCAGCSPPARA